MNRALADHFQGIHTLTPDGIDHAPFPTIDGHEHNVRMMASNVRRVKAAAYDRLHESAFQFCKPDRNHRNCVKCATRLKLMRTLIKQEYWDEASIQTHM
jgi:hypothetical protein